MDSSRARGDQVDGGHTMDPRQMRSSLHLGVDWLDGGNNSGRGHKGSGSTTSTDACASTGGAARHARQDGGSAPCHNRGSIDEARAGGSDGNHDSDGEDLPSGVGNEAEVASDGNLVNRRSRRIRQAKRIKDVTSLY